MKFPRATRLKTARMDLRRWKRASYSPSNLQRLVWQRNYYSTISGAALQCSCYGQVGSFLQESCIAPIISHFPSCLIRVCKICNLYVTLYIYLDAVRKASYLDKITPVCQSPIRSYIKCKYCSGTSVSNV